MSAHVSFAIKMKKVVQTVIIVSTTVGVALGAVCCTPFRDAKRDRKMEDLRSIVSEGDNIYSARKKIDGRYHSVSKIYDPTKLGNELLMNIDFGLTPTALETFSYVTDVRIPFDKNENLGALIEADPDGTIRDIR